MGSYIHSKAAVVHKTPANQSQELALVYLVLLPHRSPAAAVAATAAAAAVTACGVGHASA